MISNVDLEKIGKVFDERLSVKLGQGLKPIKSDISDLKHQLEPIRSDIAGIKQELIPMKADIAGIKQELIPIKSDIADLKRQQKPMRSDISKIKKDISVIVDYFDRDFIDLRKRTSRIEEYLNIERPASLP